MKHLLYLLRQPLSHVDHAIFSLSDSYGDVVVMDGDASSLATYRGGSVMTCSVEGATGLSYDDVVKRIFEYERTIVL